MNKERKRVGHLLVHGKLYDPKDIVNEGGVVRIKGGPQIFPLEQTPEEFIPETIFSEDPELNSNLWMARDYAEDLQKLGIFDSKEIALATSEFMRTLDLKGSEIIGPDMDEGRPRDICVEIPEEPGGAVIFFDRKHREENECWGGVSQNPRVVITS